MSEQSGNYEAQSQLDSSSSTSPDAAGRDDQSIEELRLHDLTGSEAPVLYRAKSIRRLWAEIDALRAQLSEKEKQFSSVCETVEDLYKKLAEREEEYKTLGEMWKRVNAHNESQLEAIRKQTVEECLKCTEGHGHFSAQLIADKILALSFPTTAEEESR